MKVVNSPAEKLSTAPEAPKKKYPFKNTLKKKNGKYNLGILIKRGRAQARAQARAYARRHGGAIPEMVAAIEAVEAFGGGELDLHLWSGAAFALGLDAFLDILRQQLAENRADGLPCDTRRAFQAKLSRALVDRLGEEARA